MTARMLLIATLLVVVAWPAPLVEAAKPTNQQLDRKLTSTRKQVSTARRDLRVTRARLGRAQADIGRAVGALGALGARLDGAEGGLRTVLGSLPQVASGLATVGASLRDDALPAIRALNDAVNGRLAPQVATLDGAVGTLRSRVDGLEPAVTTLDGRVDDLEPALTAVEAAAERTEAKEDAKEYGVTRIYVGPDGGGGPLPFFAMSSDIPDGATGATASGEIPVTPGSGGVDEGDVLSLRSAIRSSEADGVIGGDPAGHVGAILMVKCGGSLNGFCDADPGPDEFPVPPGSVLCVAGPPPTQEITLPNGATVDFPLVTILEKADPLSLFQPQQADPNPAAGSEPIGLPGMTDDDEDGCRVGEEGDVYLVSVQSQFFDIPTSLTPAPGD